MAHADNSSAAEGNASDWMDLEEPICASRAAARALQSVVDEFLSSAHPTVASTDDAQALLVDRDLMEALHYAIANVIDTTRAVAVQFQEVHEATRQGA